MSGAEDMPENIRILRFYGADAAALETALAQLRQNGSLTCRTMCKGAETLLQLESSLKTASAGRVALDSAEEYLRQRCGDACYGSGKRTLTEAAVAALQQKKLLLAAGDEPTGALLEKLLERCPAADKVYDFGAQSYAHPKLAEKIEQGGALGRRSTDPLLKAQGRLRETYHLAGADLAAGSLAAEGGTLVLAGDKKGLWMRFVPPQENAALWLLDIVRRAALHLAQAPGTDRLAYGERPQTPALLTADEAAEAAAQAAPAQSDAVPQAEDTVTTILPAGMAAAAAPQAEAPVWQRSPESDSFAQPLAQAGPAEEPPQPAQAAGDAGLPAENADADAAEDAAEDGTEDEPDEQPGRRRRGGAGAALAALGLVALFAAAAVAAAWWYTGGDLASLWGLSGWQGFHLSGASLL